tara:strand:+ start:205 stop:384 length:180 start_codon:yes stop_codon:yes gene_type:complete
MPVIARFVYEIKPGRTEDFMAKLRSAGDEKFVRPRRVRSGAVAYRGSRRAVVITRVHAT